MKKKCKRCKWEIIELNLSEKQRLEILSLLVQDLKLFAIKKLTEELKISLQDSKGVIQHINKISGKCVRCDFNDLVGENIECPKCKSFNYNLKYETSFTKEFCSFLGRKISFDDLEDEKLKGYWCDGIDHLPIDIRSLLKSNLAKNKSIRTISWIGQDGQGKYEMLIHFGEKSLNSYRNNESLVDCIPEDNYPDWIKIEPEKKQIEIKLK